MQPCAYFSKKLSPAERNYDIGNRELLAIKLAFEEWRHFLEGASHQVTVITDHKNLLYLESAKRLSPRQARWALFFTRFNFIVTYRPGSQNTKADALSRCFPGGEPREDPVPILQEGIVVSALSTEVEAEIAEAQEEVPPGLPTNKSFVPLRLRLKVLGEHHDSVLAGHPGVRGTLELVTRRFWWPKVRQDVVTYVAACTTCARAKTPRSRPVGTLLPLGVPSRPWTEISMDFITDLPASAGKTVILVVVDRFSKMAHFVALPSLPNAKTLAQVFVQEVVRLHGVPSNIVSDRGTQFVAKFWRAFCSRLGIKLSHSSAFHPQSNGQTERMNQNLEQYLRCFVSDNQEEWSTFLPLAEFALNNHRQESSGESPFFCVYGLHPQFCTLRQGDSVGVPEEARLGAQLLAVWRRVKQRLLSMTARYKRVADRRRMPGPDLCVGDWVWLATKNIRLKIPSLKLGPRFIGPFKVIAIINPVTYRLELPAVYKIHNVFHRALLKKVIGPVDTTPRPPPVLVDGEPEFEVSKVVDSRVVRRTLQYLVHWRGYGPEERSWVPAADIHAERLVNAFHRRHPDKPGPASLEGPGVPRRRRGTVMSDAVHTRASGMAAAVPTPSTIAPVAPV